MSDRYIEIREVGLRDGLQNLATILPTEVKFRLINGLTGAGIRHIEVGSFVPPKLIPQMADTPAAVAHALTIPGLKVAALVPNLKGAQLAFAAGVHEIVVPISASAMHSQANVRKSPDEMVEEVRRIIAFRADHPAYANIEINFGIGTAFGCTLQGKVEPEEVVRLAVAGAAIGADSVGLADTVGYANPRQVRDLIRAVQDRIGGRLTLGHFHDTRGLALANTLAALDCGIRRFDGSLGGLGGCPFAPGATGNVATEDMTFMLNSMGYETGVCVDRLLHLRRAVLEAALPKETFSGSIHRAGLPKTYLDPDLAATPAHSLSKFAFSDISSK